MNKADVDAGLKAVVPTEIAERMKALERENQELRQANEILNKASTYFERRLSPRWTQRPAKAG